MRVLLYSRLARVFALLAFALLLMCVGGSMQQAGSDLVAYSGHDAGADKNPVALGGSHSPALLESPDAEEALQEDSGNINMLIPAFFLVSLGLLLGAGLLGSGREQRLLDLLRLPSVSSPTPAKTSLARLEVFRL